jgi:hypothetical protein
MTPTSLDKAVASGARCVAIAAHQCRRHPAAPCTLDATADGRSVLFEADARTPGEKLVACSRLEVRTLGRHSSYAQALELQVGFCHKPTDPPYRIGWLI